MIRLDFLKTPSIKATSILMSLLFCMMAAQAQYKRVFNNNLKDLRITYTLPEDITEVDSTNHDYDLGFHGNLGYQCMKFISNDKNLLIVVVMLQHDTTSHGKKFEGFIKKSFNPKRNRAQNYLSYAHSLADTLNDSITPFRKGALKRINADAGVTFNLKKSANQYSKLFSFAKGITTYKTNRGDMSLYYFYKTGFPIDEYTKRTSAMFVFLD